MIKGNVKIMDYAFSGCTALESINVENATFIGDYAFKDCANLGSAVFGNCKQIGAHAFENCTSLTTLEIPDSITKISEAAFSNCSSLMSVRIHGSIIIGDSAFQGCVSLGSINLEKATSIGEGAFKNCTNLKSVGLYTETVNRSTFENCTSLNSIFFSESVKAIGGNAFANCTSLESVMFYCNVNVDDYAFANCSSLKSIEVQKDLVFKEHAFDNCSSLESEIIGISVTNVNSDMIAKCPTLKHVIIGYSVTSIDAHAFEECTSLESVDISRNVAIGDYAFHSCTNLKSIDFDKISHIGEGAFKDCNGLESISINGCENISAHAFENCTGLKHVIVGESVKSINDRAFKNCTSLESVEFNGHIRLGQSAFNSCTGLKTINLEMADYIDRFCFEYCTGLEHVKFGEGLQTIDICAFKDCTSLSSLDFPSNGNIVIKTGAFRDCSLETVDFKDSVKSVSEASFLNTNDRNLLKKVVIGNGCTFGADFKDVFGHDAYTESGVISKDYSNSVFELQNDRFIQHPMVKVTVDENVAVVIDGTAYTDTSFFVEKGTVVKVLVNYKDGYESTLMINNDEVEEGEYTISGDTDISAWYEPVLSGGSTDDDHVVIAFVEGIVVKCGDRILQNGETVEYGTELTVSVAEGYDYNVIKAGDIIVKGKWIAEGNTIFIGAVEDDSGIDPEFTTAVEMIAFILVVTAGALVLARYR